MIYTVTTGKQKQTYEGFRKPWNKEIPTVIALVRVDGEEDYWELDPQNVEMAKEELERYYRAEDSRDVVVLIYDRRK
jgi:translation initiation factor IF-2